MYWAGLSPTDMPRLMDESLCRDVATSRRRVWALQYTATVPRTVKRLVSVVTRGGAVCLRRGWLPQRVRVERWSSRLPMDGVWRGQSWQYDHSVLPYPVTELPSLAPHHR